MNIPFVRVTVAATLAALLSAAAAASEGPVAHLDRNADGLISRSEAVPAPRLALLFESIDGNRDQLLDADERAAFRARAHAARQQALAARFARLDDDGSGRIEGDEMAAHPRLQRLDANADGAIDAAEWERRPARRCAGRHRG